MPSKKTTGLAIALTGTIALLLTIGLPGPTWLAIVLCAAAAVEVLALVIDLRDRRA